MILLVLALVLSSGPLVLPAVPKRCVTGCTTSMEFDTEVTLCWFEDLPACHRFQRECFDRGLVVCKPRVVNLGAWDPRPAPSAPMTTYSLTPPKDSSLPPMGP